MCCELYLLYCIFCDILYTVNVVQELFKSGVVCLILCVLCVSCIMCFLYCIVWALYTVSIRCCVSKLCIVDVSPVLCLYYCQPSVPCVFCIVSPLLPAPCDECVSSVLYTCVFALLPVQWAIHVSSLLCLHYYQCSVLCVCKSCIVFALLLVQVSVHVSPVLCLYYCQRSMLCV